MHPTLILYLHGTFFWSPQVITSVDRTVFLGPPGLCWRGNWWYCYKMWLPWWKVELLSVSGVLLCESPGFPCEEDNLLSQNRSKSSQLWGRLSYCYLQQPCLSKEIRPHGKEVIIQPPYVSNEIINYNLSFYLKALSFPETLFWLELHLWEFKQSK